MNRLTDELLHKLLDEEHEPKVTIYLPTHRRPHPSALSEDQTRYKNLTKRAVELAEKQNYAQEVIDGLVSRLQEVAEDNSFWANRLECTVICVSPKSTTIIDIPIDTDEYVALNSHYYLAPLFAIAQDNQSFYTLILAAHEPKLLIGDMYGLTDSGIQLPHDPISALHIDELSQRHQHYHGRAGGFGTGQNAGSNAKDAGEEELKQFFRMVDDTINDHADKSLPLVLAGLQPETASYRRLSRYPIILEETVDGNYANEKTEIVHEKAWNVVRRVYIEERHDLALKNFGELKAQDRAVSQKAAIEVAAEAGRIETLFVAFKKITRDTVRENKQRVERITFPAEKQSKRLDEIALKAWRMGAEVISIEKHEMPDTAQAAAALRY